MSKGSKNTTKSLLAEDVPAETAISWLVLALDADPDAFDSEVAAAFSLTNAAAAEVDALPAAVVARPACVEAVEALPEAFVSDEDAAFSLTNAAAAEVDAAPAEDAARPA